MALLKSIDSHKDVHNSSLMKNKKMKHKRKLRMKGLRLRCPLCNKNIEISHVSLSACGHVFCTRCLRASLGQQVACPTCGQVIIKRKRRYQEYTALQSPN